MKKLITILIFGLILSKAGSQTLCTPTLVDTAAAHYINSYSGWQDLQNFFFRLDSSLTLCYTPTPVHDSAWLLYGNAGTTPGTNFIGTTDNAALQFDVDDALSGYLDNNTTYNTAFGYLVLHNSLGSGNSVLGYKALYGGGKNSVAIGYQALYVTNGADNVGIGYNATAYSEANGTGNVAIGAYSGYKNKGARNIFIGDSSGYAHTNDNGNLFIGYYATGTAITDSNEMIFGNYTVGNGSNTFTFGNANIAGYYIASQPPSTGSHAANLYINSSGKLFLSTDTSGGGGGNDTTYYGNSTWFTNTVSGTTHTIGLQTVPANKGGTGINTSSSTGTPYVASGTWSVVSDGTSGYVYTSNGTASTPSWQALPSGDSGIASSHLSYLPFNISNSAAKPRVLSPSFTTNSTMTITDDTCVITSTNLSASSADTTLQISLVNCIDGVTYKLLYSKTLATNSTGAYGNCTITLKTHSSNTTQIDRTALFAGSITSSTVFVLKGTSSSMDEIIFTRYGTVICMDVKPVVY